MGPQGVVGDYDVGHLDGGGGAGVLGKHGDGVGQGDRRWLIDVGDIDRDCGAAGQPAGIGDGDGEVKNRGGLEVEGGAVGNRDGPCHSIDGKGAIGVSPGDDVGQVLHGRPDRDGHRPIAGGGHKLDTAAVKIGAFDSVCTRIGIIDLAVNGVHLDVPRFSQAVDHRFRRGTGDHVCPPYSAQRRFGPVNLSGIGIEGDAVRIVEPGDHRLEIAAVQVGAPDGVQPPVGPIELAGSGIDGHRLGVIDPGCEQDGGVCAVQIGPPEFPRTVVEPIDLLSGGIHGNAHGPAEPGEQQLRVGAVQVGAPDLVAVVVDPIDLAVDIVHCNVSYSI